MHPYRLFPLLPVLLILCVGNATAREATKTGNEDGLDELFPTRERFLLDLEFGSGSPFSIHSRGPATVTSAPTLRESETLIGGTFIGQYRFSEKLQAGFQVPLGLIALLDEKLAGISNDVRLGIGDVTVFVSTPLKRETARSPLLAMAVMADSGSAKYSSQGDGFASFGLGLNGEKSLSKRFYATGVTSIIHRFEEDGLDPGLLVVPGLGGGILSPKGKYKIEVVTQYLWSRSSSSESIPEDGSKLALAIRLRGAATRHSLDLSILGLEQISRGGMGFYYTVPLHPWEKFRP